jgi:hypothetical protein
MRTLQTSFEEKMKHAGQPAIASSCPTFFWDHFSRPGNPASEDGYPAQKLRRKIADLSDPS